MENTLREWAKAYRDGPKKYRFPSDPDAEFFPVDMDDAATQIERLKALLRRADGYIIWEHHPHVPSGFQEEIEAELGITDQQTAPEK